MARVHGKNVNYSFNGTAIEGDLRSVNMTFDVPETEITAFNDAWQNFVAGKPDVKTNLDGYYSESASSAIRTLFAALSGGPVTTIFDVTGSGPDTDDPEYTSTASGLTGVLIDEITLSFPVGGAQTFTAALSHSGATTRATS